MYRLQFLNPVAPQEPVVVHLPSITIGRDAACEIQLPEKGVGDRHARIERRGDGYYLHDLESSNGSFVNGQRVLNHRLATGDELEIGVVRMRFEIVHGAVSGSRRRPLDLLQLAAVTVVVLVVGGQVALLSSIFSESRPKTMKVSASRGGRGQQAVVESAGPATAPVAPAASEPHPATEAASPPVNAPASRATIPSVLNRMIRIVRVDRSETGGVATLTIQAKAQVGERELDTSAVGICVQFAVPGETGSNVVWRDPMWLPIPAWENFKNKMFTIRFPGEARELAGFVVRTYYRNQFQDIAVAPPSLQPPPPSPVPGGVS
jgi:pSer/pThr/pTyr-binding forkhead associated (FHA) protein